MAQITTDEQLIDLPNGTRLRIKVLPKYHNVSGCPDNPGEVIGVVDRIRKCIKLPWTTKITGVGSGWAFSTYWMESCTLFKRSLKEYKP